MKYNLKNRPIERFQVSWDVEQRDAFQKYVQANREWFEGFEKELKELKRQWDSMEISMTLGWLLWEILGERK